MRTLALIAIVALSMVCAVVGDHTGTPADGSTDTDPYCLLDGLTFSNGLLLIGQFSPNKFHYQCSCSDWGKGTYTTVVRPHMMDPGSSAEIKFNGVQIHSRGMKNAISNGGPDNVAPNSPKFESNPLAFKTGTNTIVVGVTCNGLGKPPCYYEYVITCDKPDDGGFIVGDPQFVGLRGQSYQVHGVSGEIYNIVSDADLQYNSRFVFLDRGECPVVNGKKQKGCFSHAGSYLGELGLKTRAGDKIHLVTGPAKKGFASVAVNDRFLDIGEIVELAGDLGYVSRNTTHLAAVQVGNWDFAFENSDMFLNQRVRVLDSRAVRSHGLLGQTWRETTYPNAIKYIQGQVDDYVIRDGNIFGDNFVYNSFN